MAKATVNRRSAIFNATILLTAILSVWTFLAPVLAEGLIVERPLDHADVILVLAGSAAYLERTEKAAELYEKHIAHKVLLTNDGEQAGWSQDEQRTLPYVELARRQLLAHRVPDEAVEILSPEVSRTILEATLLEKKAVERRWTSLLIVTSPYHTRRALWTFEHVFATSRVKMRIGIVSATTKPEIPSAGWWWLTRMGWRDVAGEYVKGAYYWFAY